MKILAIVGSYRKKGNTAQIIELLKDHMLELAADQQANLDFEIIYLGHQNIGMCRGCRVCFDRGETKCPLKDDVLEIRAKMRAADGILVASPVYVNDVNGIIKNWIDRLAFLCHRPEFAGKMACLLTTVGLGPTGHADKTLKMALSSWGYHLVGSASFKMGGLMEQRSTEENFSAETRTIGKQFIAALHQQTNFSPSFLSLMTFRIQQGYWWREPEPGSVDYEYWKEQGWIKKNQDFYIPHGTSPIKVFFARLAGAILEPFVT